MSVRHFEIFQKNAWWFYNIMMMLLFIWLQRGLFQFPNFFPNMRFSIGMQKTVFGTCIYPSTYSSMFSLHAHDLVFSLIFFPLRLITRFLSHLFLCRGLPIWPVRNNPNFILGWKMHIGQGRLGFILKMVSWLSLRHVGFSYILAFFDSLEICSTAPSGSSSCDVSSCKP